MSGPIEVAPGDGRTFLHFKHPDGNGWPVHEYLVRATQPLREVI